MNFLSPLFLPCFFVTVLLYRKLSRPFRQWLLLAVSLGFFMLDSVFSAAVLMAIIGISYLAGLLLKKTGRRKCVLIMTVAIMTGSLLIFKRGHAGFVPIGISFYTFQALAYCIDVYRGRFPAEHSLRRYALFVSFFPQVVAGPIERPGDLLPQLDACPEATHEDLQRGGYLMLRGFARKIIIADGMAPLVDDLFSRHTSLSGPEVLIACLLFAIQIYADFSGYTDIARGSALFMGIRLSENFDHPYGSRGLRDFWRRWHITLSQWLTDYIYIPLGGNRRGDMRTALNTLIVFGLSGLWHGVELHFLIWGLAHGMLMISEDHLPHRPHPALTFLSVGLLWLLFRSPSLSVAGCMYASIFRGWERVFGLLWNFFSRNIRKISRLILLPLLFGAKPWVFFRADGEIGMKKLLAGYGLFLLILLCLFLNLRTGLSNAFIYFQF